MVVASVALPTSAACLRLPSIMLPMAAIALRQGAPGACTLVQLSVQLPPWPWPGRRGAETLWGISASHCLCLPRLLCPIRISPLFSVPCLWPVRRQSQELALRTSTARHPSLRDFLPFATPLETPFRGSFFRAAEARLHMDHSPVLSQEPQSYYQMPLTLQLVLRSTRTSPGEAGTTLS